MGKPSPIESDVLNQWLPVRRSPGRGGWSSKKLELLHPGWMGDIDEEDLVSNGTGLAVSCHGLPYDFVPRSEME